MPEKHSSQLFVDVLDVKGGVIQDAKVAYQPAGGSRTKAIAFEFDRRTGAYTGSGLPQGSGLLSVKHSRLQEQSREVTVGPADSRELFILGERGVKTYFRERVRVPVDAERNLLGVTLERRARSQRDTAGSLARELKLEALKVPELAERSGVMLFVAKKADDLEAALRRLSDNSMVESAGAVVSMRERGFSFLTRDVVVRFRGPKTEEVRSIAKEAGFTLVREVVYAPSTYVLRWEGPASLAILDVIEKLASRKDVVWAEPSLVVTPEVDAVIPNDFLWNGLWDRQLIGVQDAWQHLQDAGKPAFGDPNILLAVWDSGVQSSGGAPTNADFAGTLSNGSPKVFAAFDFDNMVANNDNPWDNHGSGVAGVSVAMANNPAPVGAASYGLTGSAPNVQIMTVVGRTPYVDIEVADQYIWMAGFDPASTLAGFPAPLSRGADVITCSLTPGAGSALSGTAKAALDFVTTFGRAGKGTMCFFSTGNANQNNVTARPWGAYEKSFGIAGTSIDNDGVTEIRAPFSGWGQIALCSPTQDAIGTVHNPPMGYMPWGAAHLGQGNLPSYAQTQTTLAAASAAGATVLTVASVAGFAVNSVIHVGNIGAAGSEPARVSAVNVGLNQLTVQGHNGGSFSGALLNAHAAGAAVITGPANHRNNFGGTSSATPLCAGAGALVLSANPNLTYIEARQILRDTAVKFDLANTDPVGQWLDANGNPSVVSGNPPMKSGWYGYGRVNVGAAVGIAVDLASSRDLVVRDNLADTGMVASAGAYWNSPDIWCRRNNPSGDPAGIPASYAVAGPHEDPKRGQSNWVYARVRNNGTDPSLDAWIRISVTHWPHMEFTYPASFQPINGPGDPLPSPMTPGTYLIGEVKVSGIAPGADQIVNIEWPASLIPPETVVTSGGTVNWHPCLLVEVTPHDGPAPTGNHVWDDNNLGQKNISIVNADAGGDFGAALVLGNEHNRADYLLLEVYRGSLPKDVQLFVDLLDPALRRRLHSFEAQTTGWKLGRAGGRPVVLLDPLRRVRVPVAGGPGRFTPIVVGGVAGRTSKPGTYEVVVTQRQPHGEMSGSATILLTIGKPKPKPQ